MTERNTIAVQMSGGVELLDRWRRCSLTRTMRKSSDSRFSFWDQTRLAGRHGMFPMRLKARRAAGSLGVIASTMRAGVARGTLKIPYYVVNQQDRFEQDVVRPFVAEYLAGAHRFPAHYATTI